MITFDEEVCHKDMLKTLYTMSTFVLFLFIVLNLINPYSPIITIGFNLLLLIFLNKSVPYSTSSLLYKSILIYSIIICIWAFFVMVVNFNINLYIAIKYLRMPITTWLIFNIIKYSAYTPTQLVKCIFFIGVINLVVIVLELVVPSTRDIIAGFIGISRMDAASYFDYRVLGITGSFEFCSILVTILMYILFLYYSRKRNFLYLPLILITYASLIFVSRTGMLFGAIILIYILGKLLKISRSFHKVFILVIISCAFALIGYTILPILINSSGLFETQMETTHMLDLGTDYGSGTASALTSGEHLNILKEPFVDQIIGYGINSEDFLEKKISTDIGYLEFVCHIGFIGLSFIIFMHLKILSSTILIQKSLTDSSNYFQITTKQIGEIIIFYIIMLFAFNYKLMLMYSRGTYDFMLILVFSFFKFYKLNKCNNYG